MNIMEDSDVYANIDYPGKQRRSPTSPENIYTNQDRFQTLEINTAGSAHSGAGNVGRSCCKTTAVCLGLLCALLLVGLIAMIVQYTKYNSECKSDMDVLHNRYNNLSKDRDQRQTRVHDLASEQHQLQNRLEEVTKEKNILQNKLQALLQGWMYFNGSFYYISTLEKSWGESRADCLQRGADLIVINSRDEQTFARSFQKLLWIGLSDRETEGTWKWVDGTPLSTSYWDSGEPNGVEGRDEDCAEIKKFHLEKSWNDESCEKRRFWICEKLSAL